MKKQKGFTLIELLIVIAIISILAALIMAGLGAAKNKARDASIKGSMDSLRASGELYASNNNESYADFCNQSNVGKVATAVEAQNSELICQDVLESWAACAVLKSDSTKVWCVDSEGSKKQITNADCITLSDTEPVCP